MATKSASVKETPESQLRTLFEKFGADEQKLIRSVQKAVRKRLPTTNELAYDYGSFFVLTYSVTEHPVDAVLSIAARPDGVRLYFMNGPKLPDPKKLLKGSGKEVRFIELESAKGLAHPDVEALIVATIAKASKPLPRKGGGQLIIRTFGGKKGARRKPAK
jgi:hypothetical protein